MRSLWKGSVAFGLVNVPVKVYSATEDNDVRFNQVHGADGGRIRYHRVCEKCGERIDFADIDKAYTAEDGRTVVLNDADFAALPADRSREIEVLQFVPTEQIDPLLFDKSYYLEPDSSSPKAYQLLLRTLQATDRLAVVTVALRQKTRLAVLRVRENVLVVQTLLWPDEIRAAAFPALDTEVKISAAEQKMSAQLVESFSGDFDAEEYHDTYREQLEEMIAAKLEGGEAFEPEAADDGEDAEVLDLLAALRRSVEAKSGTKSARAGADSDAGGSEDDDSADSGSAGGGARKSATRSTSKAAAKTTAAKSSPATTAAAKKPGAGAGKKTGTAAAKKTTTRRAPAQKKTG